MQLKHPCVSDSITVNVLNKINTCTVSFFPTVSLFPAADGEPRHDQSVPVRALFSDVSEMCKCIPQYVFHAVCNVNC